MTIQFALKASIKTLAFKENDEPDILVPRVGEIIWFPGLKPDQDGNGGGTRYRVSEIVHFLEVKKDQIHKQQVTVYLVRSEESS